MNQRIDKLMIQAGARFEFLHGVHYDDFQYRKFAELIVRECVDIVEHSRIQGDEGVCLVGATKNKIKQHFGIEE